MIIIRDGLIFEDPEARIREYCEIEVYYGYDDRHSVNDTISMQDIEAANNLYAMIDRYDKGESRRLLGKSKEIANTLTSLPNRPIYDYDEEEWRKIRSSIRNLFTTFMGVHGIGLAKTTKILHLKRPELFPIIDRLVAKLLLDIIIGDNKRKDIENGLNALDISRKIILNNLNEFKKLQSSLSDLQIKLSIMRLFDILCWTAEKWDIQRKLTAPKGTPSKSLLNKQPKLSTIKIKPTKYSTEKKAKIAINLRDSGLSKNALIFIELMDELGKRAQYGIKGEKPIALIAVLQYLLDKEITGIELIEFFEDPYLMREIKTRFIRLAEQYSKLSSPGGSWSVITGSNKEIQNAINNHYKANTSFKKLSESEILTLFQNYYGRLTAQSNALKSQT
jgi:hypothetical protein